MEDIVKKIVLKFKSEGAQEAQKTVQAVSKAFDAKQVEYFAKVTDKIQTNLKRAGVNLTTDFQKINNIFKELNEKHLKQSEVKLDKLAEKIERKIKRIQRLQEMGAPAAKIEKEEGKLQKSLNEMLIMSSQMPDKRPSPFQARMSKLGGVLSGIGFGMTTARSVVDITKDLQLARMQNLTYTAEALKGMQMQMFQGDMSRAVLYSDPRRVASIQRETDALRRKETTAQTLGGLAGFLKIAGAAALGTAAIGALSATGPLALLGLGAGKAMAGLSAGGALWAGMSGLGDLKGMYEYFIGGGKERKALQFQQMAEHNVAAQTLDPELYRQFANRSTNRYYMSTMFGLTDRAGLDVRSRFRAAGIREEEMGSLMMPFRQFGSVRAEQLGLTVADMFKQYGISKDVGSRIAQTLAATSMEGPARVGKELEKSFASAVSAGIVDSGLLEEYQKTFAMLTQLLGGKLGTSEITSQMNRFLAEGAGDKARAVQGILPAISAYGQVLSGQSPLMSAVKTAQFIDLVRGKNGEIDPTELMYLESKTPEDLAMLSAKDPVLQRMAKRLGLTEEEMQQRVERFQEGMIRSRGALGMNFQAVQEVVKKARAGEELDEGDLRIFSQAMGATGLAQQGTVEQLANFAKATLSQYGVQAKFKPTAELTPEEQIMQRAPVTEKTAAMQQREVELKGEQALDERMYSAIESRFQSILSVYSAQFQQFQKQLDEGILSDSVSSFKSAIDEMTQAMGEAAQRIRSAGGGYTSPIVITSPRPPGQ